MVHVNCADKKLPTVNGLIFPAGWHGRMYRLTMSFVARILPAGFALFFTQFSVVPQCAKRIANFWSVTSLIEPLYRAFLPFRLRLQRKARVS